MKPSPTLFQKWSRAPYWGPEEGVALAFGLDPAKVVENRFYDNPRLKAPDPAPHFAGLARRAVSRGDLEEEAQPSAFLDWAEGVGLAFHDNWTSTLNPRVPAGPDGELETVDETVTRVSEFIERRDELIRTWALAPTWTLEEGACLANNVSPRLMLGRDSFPRPHPAAESVNRLLEFALRARQQRQISSYPTPAEFIVWSEGVGFPFDAKWMEPIGKPSATEKSIASDIREPPPVNESRPVQTRTAPASETLGHKERTSLIKLVIGMAVQGYRFDPAKERNAATGEIADDLALLGIPLDRGTILKWLNEGAALLPRELEDD